MLRRALIGRVGEALRQGAVVAYPTEGVYGLGCMPLDGVAVERICALKQRPLSAGLILLAAELSQLGGYVDPAEEEIGRILAAPDRPLTWIVTASAGCPPWVSGGRDSVAIRVTTHSVAAALCRAADSPLISTSANRRGREPARSALQVRRWFRGELDAVVPGPLGGLGGPTEIRDARDGRILRAAT